MGTPKKKLESAPSKLHHRFRSRWEDNTLVVDTSHHQARDDFLTTYDLDKFTLALDDSDGLYRGILPVTEFPSLVNALKYAVNTALRKSDRGDVAASVSLTINHSIRIFTWLLREGHYTLSTLTREETGRLAIDLANQGWWKLLGYDKALQKLMAKMLRDRSIAVDIISQASNVKNICIRMEELVSHLGLPISSTMVPRYFRKYLASFASDSTVPATTIDEATSAESEDANELQRTVGTISELRNSLRILNRLALQDNSDDSISFLPFPNVEEECCKLLGNYDGRTINLPLDAAVAIFKEGLRWLYDYQDAVIEILTAARDVLEEHKRKNIVSDSGLIKSIRARVIPIAIRNNLPEKIFNQDRRMKNLPSIIIDVVFTALASLIATNQGKRGNEVIGRYRPFGLYFGCIQPVSQTVSEWRLSIYCEKSPQDWGVQWCNRLVVDAIHFLERIYQAFRPLNMPPLQAKTDENEARLDKLFQWRTFTSAGFESAPFAFAWRTQSQLFFELAGIDARLFNNSQFPFRRTFITLYVHRFDHPDLIALGDHVGHLTYSATENYFRDPNKRKPSERIGRLFRKIEEGRDSMAKILTKEREQYLTEKVAELFSGKPLGGAFPRLVFALTKRLNNSLEFSVASLQQKANTVGKILIDRGYLANEKQNGPCMAGTARHTKRHANCLQDGKLRTELASPRKCHGCVHHAPTENTLLIFEKDRDEAEKKSTDFTIPKAIRREFAKHVETMDEILQREREMAESNRLIFEKLIASWEAAIKETQNG